MNKAIKFAAVAALSIGALAGAFGQSSSGPTTTTVTSVTGTIAQLNYGMGGDVEGFLIGTDVLLMFPTPVCGGIGTLGAVGNSVTYSGTAITASSGFEAVNVSSFTNNTTKSTYTAPTSSSTAYGPVSGTVKQLNYGMDGSVDGFLFSASGSTIFVSTGPDASSTLTSLLTVNATVSVTGNTSSSASTCSSTATIQSVTATSLTIGSTTVVIPGGNGPGGGRGPGGPGGPPPGGPGSGN